MAAIYLRHPVHGQKVATSDLEANYDKGHGWSEFDPFVKPPVVPLPPVFAPPPPVVDGQDIINQMLTKPPKRTRTPKIID